MTPFFGSVSQAATMRKSHLIATAVIVAIAAAVWPYFFFSSGSPDFACFRGDRRFNVVVVTLDTTRADRLGAYDFEGVQTPAIDSLAAEGILFRRAYSVTPRAIEMVTAAVEQPLEAQDLALGYFLLADLNSRMGNPAKAREYAAKAQSVVSR